MVKRKKGIVRKETPPIIILVEGCTEKIYFDGLRSYLNQKFDSRKNLSVKIIYEKCDYTKLYNKALEYVSNNNGIFIVFDRETEHKRDAHKMRQVIAACNKKKIIPIISNQSFDLWLVLHFQRFNRECTNIKEYYKILESKLNYSDYDSEGKTDRNLFDKVVNYTNTAIANAKFLHTYQEINGEDKVNIEFNEPYTSIYKILEYLNI